MKLSIFRCFHLTPSITLISRLLPACSLFLTLISFLIAPLFIKQLHSNEDLARRSEPPYDLFLISAYYYPNSTSLGSNSISLLLTGDHVALKMQKMTVITWNSTANRIDTFSLTRITPHNVCQWISMQILGKALPNMTSMALVLGNRYQMIPFRLPEYRKYDVVTCIAPLFANEQWQYSLFAAHTYKRFGTFMHLYVRSMMTSLLKMLQIYEREGYLKIQPWMRINLKTVDENIFNPNINIEFRNQAAAQTDCLLQYKESASYISFMDLDDILIPRIGKSYLEEFNYFFTIHPETAYVHYSKENVAIKGQHSPNDFSLAQMYSSIYFKQVNETGKFVTRPATINATWIHWPTKIPDNMERYNVPPNVNAITHLKLMDEDLDPPDKKTIRVPFFEPKIYEYSKIGVSNSKRQLLSREDIRWIQSDLERMLSEPRVHAIYLSLPTHFLYFNIILKCFNDTYYKLHYSGRRDKITCPGPDRCNFPKNPGLNCSNSNGEYFSTSSNHLFNIHFVINEHFQIEDGCRP